MSAPGDFWAWSLKVYERPGVSDALIGLQDREGLEVNSVLAALYAAKLQRQIGPGLAKSLVRLTEDWTRPVVAPVRNARRALKEVMLGPAPEREALRTRIKAIELDLEAFHQGLLEELIATALPAEVDFDLLAEANLYEYLAALSWPPLRRKSFFATALWRGLVSAAGAD